MNNLLYCKLVNSFHKYEQRDYEAISNILDREILSQDVNIAVISKDPYLLLLIFTSLIRFMGIKIHIINPLEDEKEIERLITIIQPNRIIATDINCCGFVRKNIWINGNTISKEERCDVDIPIEIDFTIKSYSPYPTKISTIDCEMFNIMIESLIEDLNTHDLIKSTDVGCIPFISNNPDYLLYFIAIRIATENSILPTEEDVNLPIDCKKTYVTHNRANTIFIPKKEFCDIWDNKVMSLFEHKWIFKGYLKERWYVNLLIKRRIKRLFKGFSNLVIIGLLGNVFMTNILKNLSFINVYTIIPIKKGLFYGSISKYFYCIVPAGGEYRQESFMLLKNSMYALTYKLFNVDNKDIFTLADSYLRFEKGKTIHVNGQNKYQYDILGNIQNCFSSKNTYIFPETLEKVINSYPFIRNCALLTFNNKLTLVINPNMNILDSNRINYKMFYNVIQKQIDALNEGLLPDEYKIRGFVISTNLVETDRNGDIVRYAFNYCNKL